MILGFLSASTGELRVLVYSWISVDLDIQLKVAVKNLGIGHVMVLGSVSECSTRAELVPFEDGY
jgi:hypothetical protein